MVFLAAGEARDDQVRPFENQEMLRDCLPTHVQALAQLAERPAVVLIEAVQQLATREIGKCFEDISHKREYATLWMHVNLQLRLTQ
jgi:hypothetical protein